MLKLFLACFRPKNDITDGGSTALEAAYTVDMVCTVDMVYIVDMVYTADCRHC